MNREGGTASRLRASTLATFSSGIGAIGSPKTGIIYDSLESCGNTECLLDARGNDSFYFVSLGERQAYRIIGAIVNDRFFGLWDVCGVLHPAGPDSTQWNWNERGLWLTVFYREPAHSGIARVYAVVKGLDTLRRFFRTIAREVIM